MDIFNILKLIKGKSATHMKKIISAIIIIVLFIAVVWYYNKDNDQTKNISDAVKKQYEETQKE